MFRNFVAPVKCLPIGRSIHSSSIVYHKARTYESKPVPGSREHTHPNEWADRIFRLDKLTKENPTAYSSSEPPILNMICRVKNIKGVPFYERAILEKFGLGKKTKNYKFVVVPNIPNVNQDLMKIKHLIQVQKVTFPNGMPEESVNLSDCRLLPNGEFRIQPTVESEPIKESKEIPSADQIFDPLAKQLNKRYLKARYHQDWTRKNFFSNFFSVSYQYKLNQDGNEYRYSGLWRNDNAMKQSIKLRKNQDGTYHQNEAVRNNEADWNIYPWRNY